MCSHGAMSASFAGLGLLFSPMKVDVPCHGLVPGDQEIRIWAAHSSWLPGPRSYQYPFRTSAPCCLEG